MAVLLVAACSGGGAEDQEIQPLPSSEDDDASSTADEGEPDDDAEVEGHAAASEDEGDESQPDTDTEVDEEVDSEIDVTVIPDEITPEYVEAVLAELEQLYADALRELMLAGEPTIEVTDRLGSAFIEEEYQPRLTQFLQLSEAGFPGLADPDSVEARSHSGAVILDVGSDCIFAETSLDVSGVLAEDVPAEVSFVRLGLPDRGVANNLNRTPWMVHAFPVGQDDEMRGRRPCEP